MPAINTEMNVALVEMKTLTFSDRELSPLVFKQIVEEEFITRETNDEDEWELKAYSLNGVPLGFVNYFWDKEIKDTANYVHILWVKGTELRRSIIKKDLSFYQERLKNDFYETWSESDDVKFLGHFTEYNRKAYMKAREKFDPDCYVSDEFTYNLKYLQSYDKTQYDKVREKYLELKKTLDEKYALINKEMDKLHKVFMPLLSLPQIFIVS